MRLTVALHLLNMVEAIKIALVLAMILVSGKILYLGIAAIIRRFRGDM